MNTATISIICSVISAIGGFSLSYFAFQRNRRKDNEETGRNNGVIASDIGYIKAGVDDLKRESKDTQRTVGELNERVTRVEESCKQAHHRIDEIRDKKGE